MTADLSISWDRRGTAIAASARNNRQPIELRS